MKSWGGYKKYSSRRPKPELGGKETEIEPGWREKRAVRTRGVIFTMVAPGLQNEGGMGLPLSATWSPPNHKRSRSMPSREKRLLGLVGTKGELSGLV